MLTRIATTIVAAAAMVIRAASCGIFLVVVVHPLQETAIQAIAIQAAILHPAQAAAALPVHHHQEVVAVRRLEDFKFFFKNPPYTGGFLKSTAQARFLFNYYYSSIIS